MYWAPQVNMIAKAPVDVSTLVSLSILQASMTFLWIKFRILYLGDVIFSTAA